VDEAVDSAGGGPGTRRWAVFLDRDGTLIEDPGYLSRPEGVRVLPGVPAALRRLRAAGCLLVLVSNQSGIGRGYYAEEDYARVHAATEAALGFRFDGERHCPHHPDSKCSCRKPAPGMLLSAARKLSIDLRRSFVVGDRESDVLAGRAAGCRAVLIGPGPAPEGVLTAPDLAGAADLILAEMP
jgi:histidinol-phosphate phosphatase family protein